MKTINQLRLSPVVGLPGRASCVMAGLLALLFLTAFRTYRQTAVHAPCGSFAGAIPGAHTTVFYVNGVLNSELDAEHSCSAVGALLTQAGLSPIVNLGLVYNRTSTAAWEDCEAAILEGKRREAIGEHVAWGFSTHPAAGRGSPSPLTGSTAQGTVLVPREALVAGCDQPPDLLEARRQYDNVAGGFKNDVEPDALLLRERIRAELGAGRTVVVVAHSQGNLMFQEAVFGRGGLTAQERVRVRWLALAAPSLVADPVIGDFASVIFRGDLLERIGLRNLTELTEADERKDALTMHLLETYLSEANSRQQVVAALRRMIPVTSTDPPSILGHPAERLLLVLDLSTSMNDESKLQIAKGAVTDLLDAMPPGYEVGLLTFGAECSVSTAQFTQDLSSLRAEIAGLNAKGSTPLAWAMNEAAQVVSSLPAGAPIHVVVISDGEETCRGNPVAAARRLGSTLGLVGGRLDTLWVGGTP